MNPNQEPYTPAQTPGDPKRVTPSDIYPGGDNPSVPPALGPTDTPGQAQVTPTAPSKPPGKSRRESIKSVLSTAALFLLAPIIALSITAFAFQSYQVDGQSMETTLQNNDRLIVDKIPRTVSRITHHPYIPHRGDIVVFNQAGLYDAGGNQEKQLIKRVIGLPGERVVVQDGKVTVYNDANPNGFNPDRTGKYVITAPTTPGDVRGTTLKSDEIFVMGDNRGNSEDSRYFGPVVASRLVGKLSVRIIPLSNAKKF